MSEFDVVCVTNDSYLWFSNTISHTVRFIGTKSQILLACIPSFETETLDLSKLLHMVHNRLLNVVCNIVFRLTSYLYGKANHNWHVRQVSEGF